MEVTVIEIIPQPAQRDYIILRPPSYMKEILQRPSLPLVQKFFLALLKVDGDVFLDDCSLDLCVAKSG